MHPPRDKTKKQQRMALIQSDETFVGRPGGGYQHDDEMVVFLLIKPLFHKYVFPINKIFGHFLLHQEDQI